MGGNGVWFVLEQPEPRGKPGERQCRGSQHGWDPETRSALQRHRPACRGGVTSVHTGLTALLWSPIPVNGLISEMEKWQISLENDHSGSDDVIPVFLSHHSLLFILDK